MSFNEYHVFKSAVFVWLLFCFNKTKHLKAGDSRLLIVVLTAVCWCWHYFPSAYNNFYILVWLHQTFHQRRGRQFVFMSKDMSRNFFKWRNIWNSVKWNVLYFKWWSLTQYFLRKIRWYSLVYRHDQRLHTKGWHVLGARASVRGGGWKQSAHGRLACD